MKQSKLIYTRRGDAGMTDCPGKGRVRKDAAWIAVFGDIDELNAHIGLLAARLNGSPEIREQLQDCQRMLFELGHVLQTQHDDGILTAATLRLEHWIDGMNGKLPELHHFVLPGGNLSAAQAHVCRTVCRRLAYLGTGYGRNERHGHWRCLFVFEPLVRLFVCIGTYAQCGINKAIAPVRL